MARPLSERARDPLWYAEQAAHFGIGAVAGVAAAWGPLPLLTAPCAALWLAVVREFDQRPVSSWGDLAVDVAATVAGGLTVGGLVHAFA